MFKITTIDRYLVKRFIIAFLFMLMAIMVIVIIVDLVEKMEDFTEKKPSWSGLIGYYWRLVLYFGNMFSPICTFLAVIFFTSQMAQRTELVALLSGGVSFYRVFRPYFLVSVFLAIFSFYMTGYIVPKATAERIEFEYKYTPKKKVSRDRDIHKRVIADKKTQTEAYIYMSYFDNQKQEAFNFTMTTFQNRKMKSKIIADKATWVDSLKRWHITRDMDGVMVRLIDGDKESLIVRKSIDTTFNLTPGDIFIVEQKAETMTNPELDEFIHFEEIRGSEILKDLNIQKYRRFADPFALIILTIIGYAMSSRKSRGGTALQIGLGVVISLTYIGLLLLNTLFVSDEYPAWLAVWIPNLIFFPFSLLLLRLAPK